MKPLLRDTRPTRHRCRLLVAFNGHHAIPLDASGDMMRAELRDYAPVDWEDLGIPNPPDAGLWVWTGFYRWDEGPPDAPVQEWVLDGVRGKYRRLTYAERERMARNQPLWRKSWAAPL